MRRFAYLLSCLAFVITGLLTPALAEKRVALVIGNSTYQSVGQLPNPVNDTADMAAALERIGFAVTRANDLSYDAMRRALRDFGNEATGADMAMVFYAGHGMEIDHQNYLVPVDARLKTDLDVEYETVPLDMVMSAVGRAKGLRLVLLDACRNNPFAASMKVTSTSRAIGRGLSRVEPSTGTLVSFAAKEGTVADDGSGRNSPFTKALLAKIEEPGLEVQFLFRQVRDEVLKATDGKQEPFTYGSLPGKTLYLVDPQDVAKPVPAPGNDNSIEVAYWTSIQASKNPVFMRSYLEQYPQGKFAVLAKLKLQELEAEAKSTEQAAEQAAKEAEAKRKAEEQARAEAKAKRKAEEQARAEAEAKRKAELQNAAETSAWAFVAKSESIEVLTSFIARFPDGLYVEAARLRIEELQAREEARQVAEARAKADAEAKLKAEAARKAEAAAKTSEQQVASLGEQPTTISPDTAALSDRELALAVQEQLDRLGCDPGRPDGVWGSGSQRALDSYARNAKVQLATLEPTQQLLDDLKVQHGRICPLVCGARYDAVGDRCVLKSCPSGQTLNSSGRCIAASATKSDGSQSKSTAGNSANQCGVCLPFKQAAGGFGSSGRDYCGEQYLWRKKAGMCQP